MVYDIGKREDIVESCSEIVKIISTLSENICLNNITNNKSQNIVQNLIYSNHFEKSSPKSEILKIIIRNCIASESLSSGSGDLSALLINYFLKNMKNSTCRKSRIKILEKAREDVVDAANYFSKYIRKLSIQDINTIVDNLLVSPNLSEQLKKEILNCHSGTSFDVSISKKIETTFLKNTGNRLQLKTDQLQAIGQSSWNRDFVNVLLIDGTIESVSQIHHLLEKASSEKEHYLIMCRKASEEVKRTVFVNNIRRTIDLFLAEVGFDVELHHFFEDMSALFGCDYVNPNMGDTISSKIEKTVFHLERVEIDGNSINFKKSDKDINFISNYIKDVQNIKSSFDQSKDPKSFIIVSGVVDSRVKFMSSDLVAIRIGQDDIRFNPDTSLKVGRFFRSFPDICTTGIVDFSNLSKADSDIVKIVLNSQKNKLMTQRQLFQSLVSSFRTYETIIKSEKIFTLSN
tara:strand:- start:292 stop:1668 length:1377 start_codon:yes stop_codon:yes gene_type:complete